MKIGINYIQDDIELIVAGQSIIIGASLCKSLSQQDRVEYTMKII